MKDSNIYVSLLLLPQQFLGALMLRLLMGGIYEFRHWDGLGAMLYNHVS
jgi:hypothetical protein